MKIEVDITRQDYLNFNLYHFRKKNLLRTVLTGLTGLVLTQYLINKGKATVNVVEVIVFSVFYIALFAVIMYFNLARSKSIPKDNGSFLGKKVFDFSDDYIFYSDIDSEGRFQWNAIKSLEEDSKAFYLYLDTIMALMIPKRHFVSKLEEQAFRNYVQSKLNIA